MVIINFSFDYILLTAVDAWNISAIYLSIWIMISFYTATFSCLALTWVLTHFRNVSSRMVTQTFAIHYLGVLGNSSDGSGK